MGPLAVRRGLPDCVSPDLIAWKLEKGGETAVSYRRLFLVGETTEFGFSSQTKL